MLFIISGLSAFWSNKLGIENGFAFWLATVSLFSGVGSIFAFIGINLKLL